MEYWVADYSHYFEWFKVNIYSLHYSGFWGWLTLSLFFRHWIFKYNLGLVVWKIIGRKSFWFFDK